jgi:hypothetical protein
MESDAGEMMRLTELEPVFTSSGGEGISDKDGNSVPERQGVGLVANCPDGCGERFSLLFVNPLDGGPSIAGDGRATWTRTGETFETLTLTPAIKRRGKCQWHGFITNGEVHT